ncbi:UPF0481 protein At3g47200-like [Gastrolobium bilobum]|uniref:UPF0481 protein At3g47200-like n=1 Tax=Gastrolobium bilobum TaxID=150636 RepID=UPI002AB28E6F|nr:UPF0481 protein At3g47200-like [Gastrolobium bilobum]
MMLQNRLKKSWPRQNLYITTECCIYRVPYEIRQFNDDAYTPKVISIGPYHYGHERLQNMESHKLIYCKRFIERTKTSLESLVSCVQESEPDVRRCYSESIKLSVEEFVELILVDCCFIFELFLTHDSKVGNAIPFEGWLESCIAYDLLLLENQLPFFILVKLYTLALPSSLNNNIDQYPPSLENLIFKYFKKCNLQLRDTTASMKHFTDMLRISHLPPPDARPARTGQLPRQIYSATELVEAGVKFRVKKEGHLLDFKFSGHHLEIPKLYLGDDTEILFRNMMALEQFHYLHESYFTDYVVVLDYLINTSKDVDVLVQNEIIKNMLGNNEAVAELFNGLYKNIVQTRFNSDYSYISSQLEKYCNHPWNEAMATLRRDYWRTPWQIVASIAGILLLILTVIQTVCSVLQVLHP